MESIASRAPLRGVSLLEMIPVNLASTATQTTVHPAARHVSDSSIATSPCSCADQPSRAAIASLPSCTSLPCTRAWTPSACRISKSLTASDEVTGSAAWPMCFALSTSAFASGCWL